MHEEYKLFDNPFKLEHDHEIVGKSQNKVFEDLLAFFAYNSAFDERTGDKFISVLQGDYGVGKSFLLIKLAESITKKNARFNKIVKEDIKIAVTYFPMLTEDKKLPTNVMLHLYQRIVFYLDHDGERFFVNLYNKLKEKSKEKRVPIQKMIEELSPNFRKALLNLDNNNVLQNAAWKWISGQKVARKELESLGIPYYIDKPELAEKQIFELLKLLKILDYGLLIVLIDELEQVLTMLNEKQFWRTLVVIQEIFDKYSDPKYSHLKPITPIGFGCSLTPEARESIERGSESDTAIIAVRSRIADNIFEFEKFNDEDTEELIKVLLLKCRVKGYTGDPLFPFEKSAIHPIADITYGNPREIINKCKGLLRYAQKKQSKKIDAKLVNDYMSTIGGGGKIEYGEDEGPDQLGFLEGEEKL